MVEKTEMNKDAFATLGAFKSDAAIQRGKVKLEAARDALAKETSTEYAESVALMVIARFGNALLDAQKMEGGKKMAAQAALALAQYCLIEAKKSGNTGKAIDLAKRLAADADKMEVLLYDELEAAYPDSKFVKVDDEGNEKGFKQ